jgi:NADH-quinone oxidoreductase subunit M
MLALFLLFIVPLIGALFLFLVRGSLKPFAFVFSLLPLILLLLGGEQWKQTVYDRVWLQPLSVHFHLAVDNLSLVFLYITNIIIPISILAHRTGDRPNTFYGLILLTQGLLIGFFTARDLIFFTFFFEAILLPLYFLINRWGGPQREKASFKFIIYMIAGSSLMVAGALALFLVGNSFNIDQLKGVAGSLPYSHLIAAIFLLAFAVKTPLFPFHAWLADAYSQAPTAGTILLSALLSKAGIYGLIRISLGLFPAIMLEWTPLLLTLAVVGMLYGAFAAWGQTDYKRLIAYSSFSHVNFILAGLFIWNSMAQSGAIFQAVNHSITITGLFIVAAWLKDRLGTYNFGNVHGLTSYMPHLAWLTLFFVMSAVALPGLNSFVSEAMMLYGVFQKNMWVAFLLGTTVVLSILYMLRFMHSIYFNEPTSFQTGYRDIFVKEYAIAAPLVILILWLGLYPGPVLEQILPIMGQK